MSALCNCNVGLGNTGLPNCFPIADVAKRLILVPLFADDGTRNEYAITTTFNEAFFEARKNDTDTSKRWFPLPDIENIEDVRADAIVETFNSGKKVFIQDGDRNFSGVIPQGVPEYLGKLKSAGCVRFGMLVVDKSGNLIGNGNSHEGYLRPIEVEKGTWYVRYVKAQDQATSKIQIDFQWAIIEDDANLRMLTASNMNGYDIFDLTGLIDLYAEDATDISTTSAKVKIETSFGDIKTPEVFKGGVAADFQSTDSAATSNLYNVTDDADVAVTVVEDPDGYYTFTFAAQSAGDTMRGIVVKDGFEMADYFEFDIPT